MKWLYTVLSALLITALLLSLVTVIQRSGLSPHYLNTDFTYASQIGMKMGDSDQWKSPDFDDQAWPRYLPDSVGVFWVRAHVQLPEVQSDLPSLGMQVEFMASYDCFWDGQLIARNGQVMSAAVTEQEGDLIKYFAIPDHLATPGEHVIAFRASNQYASTKIRFWGLRIGPYDQVSQQPLQFTALIFILAGTFLSIGVYYLFIYFISERKTDYLLFGLLNLVILALIFVEYIKFFTPYPYSFHGLRLDLVQLLTLIFFSLLVAFHFIRFNTSQIKWMLPLVLAPLMIVGIFLFGHAPDLKTYAMALTGFAISAGIIMVAMFRQKTYGHLAFIGIAPCFLIIYYYDLMLFMGFANLVLFNLFSLSQQHRDQKRLQRASQLRSMKLESELLRKNIQPHFIMNTLTSVMEWIERDPGTSVKFIEALSDEFRILNDISSRKLIPLSQEIALCEVHLKIMGYRKKVSYKLELEGLDMAAEIPPAIFHSLVENGISHGKPRNGSAVFRLEGQLTDGKRLYRLLSEGNFNGHEATTEGMGTRYIKARLEDSYDTHWRFSHGPCDQGWETIIEIPETS